MQRQAAERHFRFAASEAMSNSFKYARQSLEKHLRRAAEFGQGAANSARALNQLSLSQVSLIWPGIVLGRILLWLSQGMGQYPRTD